MSDLKCTLVQTSLHWENKEANLAMLGEKIRGYKDPGHLVILPEMFSTGFSMQPQKLGEEMSGPTLQWMKNLSAEKRVILTGSFIAKEEDSYYNRLVWMLPNGQYGTYDKRHRFAFAGEDQHYTAGSQRKIATVNGWKINLNICYDLRFPVWSRQQFGEEGFEYDVLLYVANWPERRSTAWRSLLQARAIENQCYVIGVNRVGADGNGIAHSGNSSVIDPLGEILYHEGSEEGIATIELSRSHLDEVRRKFPFWKDADAFRILV